MMQLSYAQNLEDYHLDLIFAGQPTGTYVDVGGGHPVADNVSFWFYLKGWRGLVVEPQDALAELYAHVRPRDHTVSCLAGRKEGEVQFHVVDKLHGFSSTVREHAQAAAEFGAAFSTTVKPVRTLAALIAEAQLTAIDFLKIDVEGAEAEVLAGVDFERQRPRVIVLEALAPGSMADTWATWEPDLLAQGYRFALFDRLNRFYVAEEAQDLAQRLPTEPASWDKVAHLWDCGRAPERPDHPDHALAQTLQSGFFATLPSLEPALLARVLERGLKATGAAQFSPAAADALLGKAEFPRPGREPAADLTALLATDQLRAALGRIASMYDGGHVLD
ncbi:MAG TPA: FkbM family methyltransferase [Hyphomicrobiaceae bacterium]|jgi:FkbM family methyltransferase